MTKEKKEGGISRLLFLLFHSLAFYSEGIHE
jgi:hypothetical protein